MRACYRKSIQRLQISQRFSSTSSGTVFSLLRQAATEYQYRDAVILQPVVKHQTQNLDYGQLGEQVEGLAYGFNGTNNPRTSHLAVALPSCYPNMLAFLASATYGLVYCPVDPSKPSEGMWEDFLRLQPRSIIIPSSIDGRDYPREMAVMVPETADPNILRRKQPYRNFDLPNLRRVFINGSEFGDMYMLEHCIGSNSWEKPKIFREAAKFTEDTSLFVTHGAENQVRAFGNGAFVEGASVSSKLFGLKQDDRILISSSLGSSPASYSASFLASIEAHASVLFPRTLANPISKTPSGKDLLSDLSEFYCSVLMTDVTTLAKISAANVDACNLDKLKTVIIFTTNKEQGVTVQLPAIFKDKRIMKVLISDDVATPLLFAEGPDAARSLGKPVANVEVKVENGALAVKSASSFMAKRNQWIKTPLSAKAEGSAFVF